MQYKKSVNEFFNSVVDSSKDYAELKLIPTDTAALAKRMAVYQQGYKIRLAKAVVADYPALQSYAGEETFHEWVRAYTDSTPSESYNLDSYSKMFPHFLQDNIKDKTAIDLAFLEGGITATFMAPDSTPLQIENFGALSPEAFAAYRFKPRAALRLLHCDSAVNAYLTQYRAGEKDAPIQKNHEYLAICRDKFEVKRHVLDHNAYWVLHALCEGNAVSDAFDIAFAKMQQPYPTGEAIQAWFRDWVLSGFFSE